MEASIASGVIVKLLEYMGRPAVKKIAPYFGGRRKLKGMNKTMRMIQARLLDAERINGEEDGAVVKEWLKRLKHLLLLLEDLFEEIAISDDDRMKPRCTLTKPFRILLSGCKSMEVNKRVAREAETVMMELKALASDMVSPSVMVSSVGGQRAIELINSRKTHSYIANQEVVGRDDDKDEIIGMLLDSGDDEIVDVSIIPIIGIGGLGKTTLAQLVYNNEIIQQHFEVKSWACILHVSSLEDFLGKILKSVIIDVDCHLYSLEQLQSHLREAVNGKKYLLVLDDVWDFDRERWLELRRLLSGGKRGSKIMMTTRFGVVAQNMGTTKPYELRGLPEEKSWALFRSLAFRKGQEKRNSNLISIGKEIVKKCAGVPLAIRIVASLLYAKDTEEEWKIFMESEVRMIKGDGNDIMSTLKLSYDHLPSPLKQCFAYCSLFPKGYEINKQDLVYLWLAQGFITSPNTSQSLEDVAHTYFMELLRRSFFQDVIRNEYDDIISCKMHDLMHELAQHVSEGETLLVEGVKQHIGDNIWHGSFVVGSLWEAPARLLSAKRMRTLLFLEDITILNIEKIFSSLKYLRVLDLAVANCEFLPNSIVQLKLLRYLRLGLHLESLPECITRLQNLHTLDQRRCYKIKELPKGFNKLANLAHLHIAERLIDLPPQFGRLTSLRTLDVFIVGGNNGLDALANLNNLTGELKIHFAERREKNVSEAMAANLMDKKLINLFLTWPSSCDNRVAVTDDDEQEDLVLKHLQPPPSLKRLKIMRWKGVRFPKWGMDEFPLMLPNLVSISIRSCHECRQLPAFSQLPLLRSLRLWDLSALEFVEFDDNKIEASLGLAYFPSLETLKLWNLPELKGWSRVMGNYVDQQLISFACLSELVIDTCPKLVSMPVAPNLESLEAYDINKHLLKHLLFVEESPSSTLSSLRELYICSVHELVSFSIDYFSLKSLVIEECDELTNLEARFPTSLRRLEIAQCSQLRDISGALQHLPGLEELEIKDCPELDLWNGTYSSMGNLRNLKLGNIPKLNFFPHNLGCCFTMLHRLHMYGLDNLKALPEWFGLLTNLRILKIVECAKLSRLPVSFCNLPNLQKLEILNCPNL